jgi:hypothetical protein
VVEPPGDHGEGDAGVEHVGGHEVAQVVESELARACPAAGATTSPNRLTSPATRMAGGLGSAFVMPAIQAQEG